MERQSFFSDNGNRKTIFLNDTNFSFPRSKNFSGNPEKNRFGGNTRQAQIEIRDPQMAQDIIDSGVRVSVWQRNEESDPVYSITAIAKYRNRNGEELQSPPEIILISGQTRRHLTEETVKMLDGIRTERVDVTIAACLNDKGTYTNYIRTMHVYQALGDDPLAGEMFDDEDEEIPFA